MSDVLRNGLDAVEGLRRFLLRSRELRDGNSSRTVGLKRFLDRAGPLLQAPLTVVTGVPPQPLCALDPVRLRYILSALARPLRCAPPITPPLNVWSVAGLKRDELRNASVLAWFLDPQASHGLGSAFLAAFLGEIGRTTQEWPELLDLARTTVATEEWPLNSANDRVDIALDGPDFVLFVEVKIDAPEGPDQLARYTAQARRKADATGRAHGRVIYLTRRRPPHLPSGIATITWREVASALSAVGRQTVGGSLATQFAQHIRAF